MHRAGPEPRATTPAPNSASPEDYVGTHRLGARGRRTGLTRVESAAGIGVLLLALAGFAHVLLFAGVHPEADQEYELARQAARRILVELQQANFADVYTLFNEDPFDDPQGVDTAPGNRILVDGLVPSSHDPTAPVGSILFPTLFDFDAGMQLREDILDPALGMPRDLNGDGRVDHSDHADDYVLLPVRVRIEWVGVAGPTVFEVETLLADY